MEYKLRIVDGKVPYMMVAGKDFVAAESPEATVRWIIENGKLEITNDVPGYPLCVDGKWYIAGTIEQPQKGRRKAQKGAQKK